MSQLRLSKQTIVLVVEGLPAAWSGAYGAGWIATPALNALAGRGVLAEQFLLDSPDARDLFAGILTGRRTVFRATDQPGDLDRQTALQSSPLDLAESLLVTDDRHLVTHPLAGEFLQQRLITYDNDVLSLADDWQQTRLAQFFAEATAAVDQSDASLIWLQTRGLAETWDAPWSFRAKYRDQDDPLPPDNPRPPESWLADGADLDERIGWLWALAGQIELLDRCLLPLIDAVLNTRLPTRFFLLGASPCAVGEHGYVGTDGAPLFTERIHAPLIVFDSQQVASGVRRQKIVQPVDLLHDWLLADSLSHSVTVPPPEQTLAVAQSPGQWLLRTHYWQATCGQAGGADVARGGKDDWQLFVKPDDRWDVNDVAGICTAVVDQFRRLLETLRKSPNELATGGIFPLPPLLGVPPE